MADILASAALVDGPLGDNHRFGPWLVAWHDPVAVLACNGGCIQVIFSAPLFLCAVASGLILSTLHFIGKDMVRPGVCTRRCIKQAVARGPSKAHYQSTRKVVTPQP